MSLANWYGPVECGGNGALVNTTRERLRRLQQRARQTLTPMERIVVTANILDLTGAPAMPEAWVPR